MSTHSLHTLFHPRAIAVVGASADATRIRGRILEFLAHGEYRERVYPVNPSYREINGIECYASVAEAAAKSPIGIDLAVIVIPAKGVVAELERCAAAGVHHALIVSSGFAEEGGDRADVQARIAEIAKTSGMRVLGPNSEGFFSAVSHVRATFSPTVHSVLSTEGAQPRVGAKRIGVIAQSGGMGFGIMHRGHALGLAHSHVLSTGNEADIDLAACLEYMADDPDTDIVALYLECVRDPARFEAACVRAAAKGKPIVALKVGGSTAGQRATQSHTASIAGWSAAYEAFFVKYAIVSAADVSEMLAILGVLSTCADIAGNRVGVLTGSGGAGALIADTLERHGLTLPVLSPATQQAIRAFLPSYATAQNPVDITAGSGGIVKGANVLLGCNEIDVLVSVHSMTSETSMSFDPQELTRERVGSGKPLCAYCYTDISRYARGKMAEAGVFVHADLQLMASALAKLLERTRRLQHAEEQTAEMIDAASVARASEMLRERSKASANKILCEYEVKAVLRECGIDASRERLCRSAKELLDAAVAIGYPLAVKIQSPAIVHKTEVGGVRLGIANANDLLSAYGDVSAAALRAPAQVAPHGVLLQKMAPAGYELIIGMVDDPSFGPIMMVGMGGVAVELYRDVAYYPAPVSVQQAERLLHGLKSSALFNGFRGRAPVDLRPVAELIARVSELAAIRADGAARIAELELNPVIVHADGSGLTIADAYLRCHA